MFVECDMFAKHCKSLHSQMKQKNIQQIRTVNGDPINQHPVYDKIKRDIGFHINTLRHNKVTNINAFVYNIKQIVICEVI